MKGTHITKTEARLMGHGMSLHRARIAIMAAQGMPAKEIGDKVAITIGCVKFHITAIYKSFAITGQPGVSSRAELKRKLSILVI